MTKESVQIESKNLSFENSVLEREDNKKNILPAFDVEKPIKKKNIIEVFEFEDECEQPKISQNQCGNNINKSEKNANNPLIRELKEYLEKKKGIKTEELHKLKETDNAKNDTAHMLTQCLQNIDANQTMIKKNLLAEIVKKEKGDSEIFESEMQ